jgi:hypothetical protein
MTYEEIIERAALKAQNLYPGVPLSRLRVAIEAEFSPTLRETAEWFAGTAKGDQLRQDVPLTFASGFVIAPDKILLKHLKHARLFTSDANAFYSHEREGSDLSLLDRRMGYWKITGTTIEALTPTDGIGLDGAATLDAICVPDTPTLATDPFTGPADMEPQLIDALCAKMAGKSIAAA